MATTFEIENVKVIFEGTGDYTPVAVVKDGHLIGRDWHRGSEYNMDKHAAKYYFSKHHLKVDNQALLRKAVKKEAKPQVSSKKGFAQWLLEHYHFEVVGMIGTYTSPLDAYLKAMKESGKWNGGSFLYGNVYHNRPRWMRRFNNYCEAQDKREVLGCEVYTILNGKEWDSKEYDD